MFFQNISLNLAVRISVTVTDRIRHSGFKIMSEILFRPFFTSRVIIPAFIFHHIQGFLKFFHLFLSLNAPHCGVTFSKRSIDWGSRFLSFVNSSQLVDELLLKDDKNPRNTLLYRMSQNSGRDRTSNMSQICRRSVISTYFRRSKIRLFRFIRNESKRLPRFYCRKEWRAKSIKK